MTSEMKPFEELFREIEGQKKIEGKTYLQIEEHIKKLIGIEVEVLGVISNITADYISLTDIVPDRLACSFISIHYEGDNLREELLEYSSGDGVCLTTRLTGVTPHGYRSDDPPYTIYTYYTFHLLSIRKLKTRRERENAKEAEQKALQQKAVDSWHQEQLGQTQKNTQPEGGRGTGCFVATAAFRNYDAPEVIFLRGYRDESLSKSALGRAFIQAYYTISPSLAAAIAKSELLRTVVRKFFLQPTIFLLRYFKR